MSGSAAARRSCAAAMAATAAAAARFAAGAMNTAGAARFVATSANAAASTAGATNAAAWLPPAAFAAALEPYKRVVGILIREDCCSLAVSTPYLNLAEKVGGVMLRAPGNRVPARSLQLLVKKAVPPDQIAGLVIGCERGMANPAMLPPERAQTLRELLSALQALAPAGSPALPLCWHVHDPSSVSCRISPPPPPPPQQQQQQEQQQQQGAGVVDCNAGGQMLQAFLDSLGALNTFG